MASVLKNWPNQKLMFEAWPSGIGDRNMMAGKGVSWFTSHSPDVHCNVIVRLYTTTITPPQKAHFSHVFDILVHVENSKRMSPRFALVTGGSRGIGRAICEKLASNGVIVAVGSRQQATAQQVADALPWNGVGHRHVGVACSVEDPHSIAAVFSHVTSTFPSLDSVVCCAGAFQSCCGP